MRRSARTFAVGLLLSAALPAGAALASDPAEQLLLERANYWRAQHRPDLVGQILARVLTANPDQPDALYQQGALALEQGDRGGAERYFDRLRQLAAADSRAAELVNGLAQTGKPPSAKPVIAVEAPPAAAPAAAPRPHAPASFFVASADSDDLTPVTPVRPTLQPAVDHVQPAAPKTAAGTAPVRQLAALPPTTVSDGDMPLAVNASAGSADLGITAKAVQVAQVELEAPPPVAGYQLLGALKPYSPTDTLEINIERDLARLESEANPTLIAGFGYRTHSGTEGTSRLDEVGIPIQASFSPWYTGTARLDVIPVWMDAGTPANGNLGNFGANPLTYFAGNGAAAAGNQSVTGVGLVGNYTWTDFSGQFGTTPLGFPVTNLIGDLAYTPKFLDGTLAVRLEGQRQPVTDSLLSYAGTKANFQRVNAVLPGVFAGIDPLWGGVVKTGGRVTAFYDDQSVGAYGGFGLASVTGKSVAQNSSRDAILGAYFRPWKTDEWTLRAGVSLYYIGYDKNLDGFTFGQGGYFSPHDFEGLGFPLELTGRTGPWSYLASATLGVQHFNTGTSFVFPNNPTAQAVLESRTPNNSTFGGLHSTGFGYNFKGQVEYALDPTASVGIAGSLNNGNAYTEGIVQAYVRKTFDWFVPVAAKNDPQSIAARDLPMSRL